MLFIAMDFRTLIYLAVGIPEAPMISIVVLLEYQTTFPDDARCFTIYPAISAWNSREL
jgi:hypothetical protein